jgi:hypothetical protein
MLRFLVYIARWQLSTPILWLVVSTLGADLEATVVANLVGASIFFWVDQLIFRAGAVAVWETIGDGSCAECGQNSRVRRLVLAPSGDRGWYDRRQDHQPEYRCAACSTLKLRRLKELRAVAASVGSAG